MIRTIWSLIWRSSVTALLGMLIIGLISTAYQAVNDSQKSVHQYALLADVYAATLVNTDHATTIIPRSSSPLLQSSIALRSEYFIENEGKQDQRFVLLYNRPSDSPYMQPRELYSYALPSDFSNAITYYLADEPMVYAIDPEAQLKFEQENSYGLGVLLLTIAVALFGGLILLSKLWQNHPRRNNATT